MLKMRAEFSKEELAALKASRIKPGISRAMKRAAATSIRTMKSEASKRIRKRKRIKVKAVNKAIKVDYNKGREIEDMNWGLRIRGDTFRLVDYPHRQIKKGVSASVNKGKRTVVKGAFIATMPKPRKKGGGFGKAHVGVFKRVGPARLKIRELLASRPVDALLHEGEADAISAKGRGSFFDTMDRLLAAELDKGGS